MIAPIQFTMLHLRLSALDNISRTQEARCLGVACILILDYVRTSANVLPGSPYLWKEQLCDRPMGGGM